MKTYTRCPPLFRPDLVPAPWEVGGLQDAIFWMLEREMTPDGSQQISPAHEALSILGTLLYHAREVAALLEPLWRSLRALNDLEPLPEQSVIDQKCDELIEAWNAEHKNAESFLELSELMALKRYLLHRSVEARRSAQS